MASSIIDSKLHECVRLDDIEAFKSRVTPGGNTLLHVAEEEEEDLAGCREEKTRESREGKENLNLYTLLFITAFTQKDTILHLAAREGKDSHIIKSLVQSNPCLMRKANTKGNTPLHDAVIKGNRELAKFSCEKLWSLKRL
uniref:Uncharacterized protein n=1 Tax=Salix viminalis TaxID=40686 RepID=A0A6N2MAX0_SALVM